MVKIRGYSVELQAVEAALLTLTDFVQVRMKGETISFTVVDVGVDVDVV